MYGEFEAGGIIFSNKNQAGSNFRYYIAAYLYDYRV